VVRIHYSFVKLRGSSKAKKVREEKADTIADHAWGNQGAGV